MNKPRCQKIASRIHTLLVAEIGQGIDTERLLDDALYARDVLLVCDALPGTEGAQLAATYRTAALEKPVNAPAPRRAGGGISGFISSIFGPISTLDPPSGPPPKRRPWFGRGAAK